MVGCVKDLKHFLNFSFFLSPILMGLFFHLIITTQTMPRVGLEHSIRLVLGMNPNGPNQTVVTTSGQQRIFDIRCQYFADRNQTIGRVLELR
jgi:hypothetical protein